MCIPIYILTEVQTHVHVLIYTDIFTCLGAHMYIDVDAHAKHTYLTQQATFQKLTDILTQIC